MAKKEVKKIMAFNNLLFKKAFKIKRKGTVNAAFSFLKVVNKNLNLNILLHDSAVSYAPESSVKNVSPPMLEYDSIYPEEFPSRRVR